jgi:hypothetical protein
MGCNIRSCSATVINASWGKSGSLMHVNTSNSCNDPWRTRCKPHSKPRIKLDFRKLDVLFEVLSMKTWKSTYYFRVQILSDNENHHGTMRLQADDSEDWPIEAETIHVRSIRHLGLEWVAAPLLGRGASRGTSEARSPPYPQFLGQHSLQQRRAISPFRSFLRVPVIYLVPSSSALLNGYFYAGWLRSIPSFFLFRV